MKNPDFCSFKFRTVTITDLQNQKQQQTHRCNVVRPRNHREGAEIAETKKTPCVNRPKLLLDQESNNRHTDLLSTSCWTKTLPDGTDENNSVSPIGAKQQDLSERARVDPKLGVDERRESRDIRAKPTYLGGLKIKTKKPHLH